MVLNRYRKGMTTTFDLEERTLTFALNVRNFVQAINQTQANKTYGEQLLRSSGSVGANYIEANDALGKKDFLSKIKTSRREAKESRYWLRLLQNDASLDQKQAHELLIDEAGQLIRILSAIASKIDI